MNIKPVQMFLVVCTVIIMLFFVKLMYDMNQSMTRMTAHVGSLAADVSAMRGSMIEMTTDIAKMRESMQRMDANIQGMGSAVERGGKLFQQWDPTQMIRQ